MYVHAFINTGVSISIGPQIGDLHVCDKFRPYYFENFSQSGLKLQDQCTCLGLNVNSRISKSGQITVSCNNLRAYKEILCILQYIVHFNLEKEKIVVTH